MTDYTRPGVWAMDKRAACAAQTTTRLYQATEVVMVTTFDCAYTGWYIASVALMCLTAGMIGWIWRDRSARRERAILTGEKP
jgi:uncharacterized membrane protein